MIVLEGRMIINLTGNFPKSNFFCINDVTVGTSDWRNYYQCIITDFSHSDEVHTFYAFEKDDNYGEYVTSKLNTKLPIGTVYYFRFYVIS
jgi:hypothetical protein